MFENLYNRITDHLRNVDYKSKLNFLINIIKIIKLIYLTNRSSFGDFGLKSRLDSVNDTASPVTGLA